MRPLVFSVGRISFLIYSNILMKNSPKYPSDAYDVSAWNMPCIDHKDGVDFSKFDSIEAIHRIYHQEHQSLDFYAKPGRKGFANSKNFLFGLNGAIDSREKKMAPFFSGIGIADVVDLPLLAISDPSLSLSRDLSLG